MTELAALLDASRRRRELPDGRTCRLIRERAGLTQEDVATLLGVRRSTVSRWEAGLRTPRREIAERYSDLIREIAREML